MIIMKVPPSRWPLATALLSLVGIADAAYLLYIKMATVQCGVGGCDIVNTSAYSEVAGIPVAAIGLVGYIVILILAMGRWVLEGDGRALYLTMLLFVVALAGTLYSAYLTYLEVAVIRAICPYCVVSAIIISLITIVAAIDLRVQYA
jgi:uncharacterized membrane protein